MKVIIHLAFGIALRVLIYFSNYQKILSQLIIFDNAPYSFSSLRENYFYTLFKSTTSHLLNSDNVFIATPLTKLYNHLKDSNRNIFFVMFLMCDMMIGLLLYKLKRLLDEDKKDKDKDDKEQSSSNEYILALYAYNPVSIINCSLFRLDVIYMFIHLMFIANYSNCLIAPIFLVLSIYLSPGYFFINVVFLIYISLEHFPKIKKTLIISTILIIAYLYLPARFNFNSWNNTKDIYYNYFFIKDTLPNFSFLWCLLPGTFLKYQNYTLQLLLLYQFTLCLAVALVVKRVEYKYKASLSYAMIFLMSHILDRYPCENHYIICLLMLFQHWDIVKQKIINLAVYGSFAGYTLILCRGFPFIHRKTGSSNYLFFQNITYSIAMTFILMCAVNGIEDTRKKQSHYYKMKEEVQYIINKALA